MCFVKRVISHFEFSNQHKLDVYECDMAIDVTI